MMEFLITFCILSLIFVFFAGGKFAAEGIKSAVETKRDPDILIEDKMRKDERWSWQPKLKERRKGRYDVTDAYMTKSMHFAIDLLNVKTGERYTVYDKLPLTASAKADCAIIVWKLQELNPEETKEGKYQLPHQPRTGEKVT